MRARLVLANCVRAACTKVVCAISESAVYASSYDSRRPMASESAPVHGVKALWEMPIIPLGNVSSPVWTRAKNCEMPSAYASSHAFSSLSGASAAYISLATRPRPMVRIAMSWSMRLGSASPSSSAVRPSAKRRSSSSCTVRSLAHW